MITNRHTDPSLILDVRTLDSADIGNDHSLLLLKIRVQVLKGKKKQQIYKTQLSKEVLEDTVIQYMYIKMLESYISQNTVNKENDVDKNWEILKHNILQLAR
jgi:hypothetical protein